VSLSASKPLPKNGIDAKIASAIAYPFYYTLDITTSSGNIQDMKIDTCKVTNGSVSDAFIFTEDNFKDPIIGTKISLTTSKDSTEQLDSVTMQCQFSFIIRSGTKVYQLPEKDNVTLNIKVYNFPLGYLPQAVKDDIMSLNAEIEDLEGTISDLETANDILGTICTLADIIGQGVIMMQAAKTALYLVLLPFVKWSKGWYTTSCILIDKVSNFLLRYAYNPSLSSPWKVPQGGLWATSGWYLRILCTLYTCELSEATNFIEAFSFTGTARGNTFTYTYKGDSEKSKPSAAKDVLGLSAGVFTDYDYSPYKSKDVAWAPPCVPALLYNYKKERQIKCLQRKCIKDRATSGFSTETCDKLYKVRECVYIEGAALKPLGSHVFLALMQGLAEFSLNVAVQGLAFWPLSLKCGYLETSGTALPKMTKQCGTFPVPTSTICGLGLAAAVWADIGDTASMFAGFDLNKYNKELEKQDFCTG
jgi:hypothetical protein